MPIKNRVKSYHAGKIYHIYNKGIDEKEVFRSGDDFEYFTDILKRYLMPFSEVIDSRYKAERPYIRRHKQNMNLKQEVDLLVYCLLPDHFHLVIKQHSEDGVTKLMRRVITNYVMYFNKKYKRRGMLFENVYRAVEIPTNAQLLEISKYIHLNPFAKIVKRFGLVETVSTSTPEYYNYSSYHNYVGTRNEEWVNIDLITDILKKTVTPEIEYREFLERVNKESEVLIGSLLLEDLK